MALKVLCNLIDSVKPRHVFRPLNQYGHPDTDPKSFRLGSAC